MKMHLKKEYLKKFEVRLKNDARELGLSFDDVIFKPVPPEEIRDIAAFGLPNRYIHWEFGGRYKNLDILEKKDMMHIQELVLNSIPVVASLSTKNTHLEHLIVMAHVLGHADIFHNHKDYKKTDKDMVSRAGEHVLRIESIRKKHKRSADEYLTALMTVAKASMNTFQFPEKKKESLFYVLYEKASKEYHEKQLFDIVKEESEYFDVIFRTQFVNEGWAFFIERELLKDYFPLDEWTEYAMHSSSLPLPYQIGERIFTHIKQKYGFQKCLEVRKYYDDIAFVQEFLTEELVDILKLKVRKGEEETNDLNAVIAHIIDEKKTLRIPPITIDAKRQNRYDGTLYLVYHETEGKKLDTERRLELYLKNIYLLWKNEINLVVYDKNKKVSGLFSMNGNMKMMK